jgi:hypothetical protein
MSRLSRSASAIAVAAALMAPPALAGVPLNDAQLGAMSAGSDFTITNRVSNQVGHAPLIDPDLQNAWGLSQGPGTFLWVSNNGSDTSTIYNPSTFAKAPLTVNVPGGPTGTTFVGVPGAFNLHQGGKVGNTLFAFATEGGQILGWSPTVNATNAVVGVDESKQGGEFKGLTLGASHGVTLNPPDPFNHFGTPVVATVNGAAPTLFATDFGKNVVEGFDSSFHKVMSFTDSLLPANYTPFNVQNLNGLLYVTFAQRDPGAHDENHGPGLGFVDIFTTNGQLLKRLVSNGPLNAPWGLAIAPQSFGKFAGALLVGNFGDGQINAFNPLTGQFLGRLDDGAGPNGIDGLWALHAGPNGTITFSAGPNEEANGLIGSIRPTAMAWGQDEVIGMAEMHR